MTFNSLQFAGFFVVVLLIYYRLQLKGQNLLIVVAGVLFYGAFDWRFPVILAASTVVDYTVGRGLQRTEGSGKRKALLATSLVAQLGLLAYFKYFDFFTSSVSGVLHRVGLHGDFVTLNIILPIGISFYTFQTLGYVITVYRRGIPAEKNFLTFATFVSWFPVLLAGPIGRAPAMLPQFRRRREVPSRSTVESALLLILFGLVKKVVVADALASYVNTVYANPGMYGWESLGFASVAFALQVYGDFSGYSDMARGLSRLLGVEVARNFEQPFLSRDIREFWTRWHTSMASWFVDFVGGPLGGAGRGRWRAALNVMIIMALIGLWHGPAWHFVLWGVFNGVLIVVWRLFGPPGRNHHPMKLRWRETPGIVLTFVLFCIGAVLFRATTIHEALVIFHRTLFLRGGAWAGPSAGLVPLILALVVVLDLIDRRARIRTIETVRVRARLGAEASPPEAAYESLIVGMPALPAGMLLGALVAAVVVFSGGAPVPFIYFHF
ncbi:MAG TPA: MBOAT family O-acyltransferase [Acidimicrobiales bacterium]|jgi:D-alanyl-lipoteichoic acid acyltransferase DltB (MBOAT superfamily)|nr:MBOAT family O-acyltransferase [Acidimicrobiales bacterium]